MNLSKSKTKSASPTQKFVEVQDIKEDVVLLKNGGLRAVLIASSINFELKNSEEQEALIARYQGFLNSLDFPLQILINSRRLNIEPYIKNLEELAKAQTNELLHAQTIEYTEFIQKFVNITDIMHKSFYVIIPYNPTAIKKEKFLDKIKYIIKPKETVQKMPGDKFQEYKNQLTQRVSHIATGLASLEVQTTPLSTEQLTKLFYDFYNPEKR